MKKLFFKILAVGLFLLAMPLRQFGQEIHIRDYENGFLFNVFCIANVEERIQLASALATSDIWICNPTDNPGELFIRPNNYHEDIPIYAEFEYLRMTLKEEYLEASSLSKEEFGEIFNSWAQSISADYYNFLISDLIGERANHCMNAEPFCTTDVYNFPAINSGVSWSGPNYGCLGSSPTSKQSFWYYMRVGVAGNITIKIEASFDVDFALWGPFSNETDPCPTNAGQAGMLTATCTSCPNNTSSTSNYPYGNLHDCSYDVAHSEYAHVVNGQVGQYFILLITNYSGSSGNITFQKYAGNGETDCGILPPLVNNDGPFCVGDAIHLTANGQQGASYHWTGPNNYSSNQQNPTLTNCNTTHTGTYTCTITVGNQSNNATTEVRVYPKPTANFTATSVCKGESTQFTNSSTSNPANQSMSYLWDFGDGQTSNQTSPSHQFATAGNHTVTLTASCGNGTCTSTKTQSVTVYETPVANAGDDQTVQYGATAQLHGSGGSGTFNYHWEPSNKVVNPNSQNTATIGMTETTTFTLTVTHPQGGCASTDQVNVLVSGSNMTATASASPNSICRGETSQLSAIAVGGNANNYSYSWSPSLGLSDPLIANPVASPTATTTYTCNVSDGYTSQQVSTTVTVNQPEYVENTEYICPGDTYNFYGTEYSEVGDYNYNTTTSQGCEKIITLHLRHYPSYENAHTTTEYICPGTSYNFHGHYYSTTGLHPETLHTIHGCDSVVWLDLTVYPANDTTLVDAEICTSQTYNFHGIEYNTDTIVYFDTLDHHGCLKVEKLVLGVGPYQKPPKEQPRICYAHDDSPSYYWDKTQQTYTEDTYDEIILPDPDGGCDVLHRLDLKFHQEFYRTETETVCDQFVWHATPGITYNTTNHNLVKVFHDTGGSGFACDSTFVLDLTVNHSTNDTIQVYNQCNQYDWQFGWNNETYSLTEQDNYTKVIDTHLGCDSIVTLKLQLDYTPDFDKVYGNKWVVGGSEFQFSVERYWIELEHPNSTHQTTWELHDKEGNPFNKWEILPYGNGDNCYLYIYTFERDTIWLHAHTESTGECECGSDDKELWIVCGYHSVNETIDPCTVDIFPNPNDGNMTLSFDNMEGETLIKVYNITGTLVDQFTIHNEFGHWAYTYQSGRLTPGVYFFNIANKKGILTKKVIILD